MVGKLNQIKKVRELTGHDVQYMKEMLIYIAKINGFFEHPQK